MTVLVWSELPEPNADNRAHDCAYSSALMELMFGGFGRFPFGTYTVAEREALEDSDFRPDEEGASPADIDIAVLNRYGLRLHKPTEPDNRSALSKVGRFYSVGGQLSNLPYGNRLRKYAPNYTGGHRVGYLALTTTAGSWFDPLAPNKSAGVPASLDEVVMFSEKRAVTDLRYTTKDEFATTGGGNQGEVMGLKLRVPDAPASKTVRVAKGKVIQRVSDMVPFTLDVDITRAAYATVLLNSDGSAHDMGWIVNHVRFGVTEEWFVSGQDVT